jgi:hypothetical protein
MVSQVNETAVDTAPDHLTLRVRKRPWYVWLLRAVWVVWIMAWLEFAIGSRQEIEPQAFSIAVRVLIVSLLLGLGLYFWRLREERKGSGEGTAAPAE